METPSAPVQTSSRAEAAPMPPPTLAQLAEAQSPLPVAAEAAKHFPTPDLFSKFLVLEGFTHWFFRLGFASIFFVNAIYAAVEPKSFSDLLVANPIANAIGYADLMVKVAMVNDLLLTVFIVGGWRKRMVYAWAGAWLLLVAGLKLMNLFF